eukprot:GHVP01011814.1.p1 GENE.GHVP01011814.1~~GHVP01011814.1.p1  ORF type:complete len:185 (+),score=40.94 GHVP01011814.1:61-555(+)
MEMEPRKFKINIGKIEAICLDYYAVNVLDFLELPVDNVVKKLHFVNSNARRAKESFSEGRNKIINIGRIEEIYLRNYPLKILQLLEVPADNVVKKLEFTNWNMVKDGFPRRNNKIINIGRIEEIYLRNYPVHVLRLLEVPEDNVVKKLQWVTKGKIFLRKKELK